MTTLLLSIIFVIVILVVLFTIYVFTKKPKPSNNGVVYLCKGQVWYASEQGVYLISTKWSQSILRVLIKRSVISATVDLDGLVWRDRVCFGKIKRRVIFSASRN